MADIDITTWTSPIKEINDYLKTHDSFEVAKDFVDEKGRLRQGKFMFTNPNKNFGSTGNEVLWTLTIDDPKPDISELM